MHIRTPADLGAAIRDRRKGRGWDQQTLAEKIKVSRQWVIEAEKGKPRAEVGLILRALDALGGSLSIDGIAASGAAEDVSVGDIDRIVEDARRPSS